MAIDKKCPKLRDILEILDNEIELVDSELGEEAFIGINVEGEFDWKRYTLFSDKLLDADIDWLEHGDEVIRVHLKKGWNK